MNRFRFAGIFGLLLALLASGAAADLIPTPDFSDHPIPTAEAPDADSLFWEYVDVAFLFAALSLATYLALAARSRRGLFLLAIVALLWLGFWREGCVCPIGATQNIALAVFDPSYVIPWSVTAIFVLPLVFTLFFGRTFCSSVCPLGAIQELATIRSLRVPQWLDHTLGLAPYIYLGAAVLFAASGTAFLICRYDPFVAFFRLNGNANILIFGGCLLFIGLFVGRPYCRYLCPYGAILAVLSKFSSWCVRIPPTECINCRLCEDVCPYGAIQTPTSAPSPGDAERDKRRLGLLLLSAPFLVAFFAWVGVKMAVPLSWLEPEVQLAEQLRREELGLTETVTDASEAFRNSQRAPSELYQAMIVRREHFRRLGALLGAWIGLVISVKLVSLAMRQRRPHYRANPSGCVSCGRCFWYCPLEQARLGLIEDPAEMIEDAAEMPHKDMR
jgi:ferredoxin